MNDSFYSFPGKKNRTLGWIWARAIRLLSNSQSEIRNQKLSPRWLHSVVSKIPQPSEDLRSCSAPSKAAFLYG